MSNLSNLKNFRQKACWILKHSKKSMPVLILIVMIQTGMAVLGIYNTIVTKHIINNAIDGNSQSVVKWLFLMGIIMLMSIIVTPVISLLKTHASTTFTQDLQKELYNHVQYSEWQSQSRFHSVNILTRITNDVESINSMLINTVPTLISLLVTLIGSFTTLALLAPKVAAVGIVIAPILGIIGKVLGRKLNKIYKLSQEEDVKYKTFIQETLQNLMTIKAFCKEKLNSKKLAGIQKNKYKLALKNTKLSALTSASLNLCSSLAYLSIFVLGILDIAGGALTYGDFTAMIQLYNKIEYPIQSLASLVPSAISSLAAAERLMELEDIPLEKECPDEEEILINFPHPDIKLSDVYFEYDAGRPIINNLSLEIDSGNIIAVLGPSGEGKTTLLKLLLSFLNPQHGSLTISENGRTTDIDRRFRQLISYVPQGNTLFSGTIRDNLEYGLQNSSEEEITDALKKANAYDFVMNLPKGIDTVLGEKSNGISAGQAQRLCIARAFLRKAPVLVLDEATSALDAQTEINVLKEIKNLAYKPTCIIITHRLSALKICDKIYDLKKGQLYERDVTDVLQEI